MDLLNESDAEEIDKALSAWRQGDCSLKEDWFLYRVLPDGVLTSQALDAARLGAENTEAAVQGFCVLTQTCDIVRHCLDRPFVEICPLVAVEPALLAEIERGVRPNYAHIPGVSAEGLVADLDRVMTVEKTVVASWTRISGCQDDTETRTLAHALARKRIRFAFPDDFVRLVSSLRSRIVEKHRKESDEGRALRALREIRVRAAPSWSTDEIELMFYFIRHAEDAEFEDQSWDKLGKSWMSRVSASGRYSKILWIVTTLEDMTAQDYVESDPLDLDHLSIG